MRVMRIGAVLLCAAMMVACGSAARTPTPLALPAPGPTITPTPAITPSVVAQRVRFSRGSTSVTLPAQLSRETAAGFVLRVLQGQTMTVRVSRAANITILNAQGQSLASAGGALRFPIPQSGDYTVVVSGEGEVQVEISIPPR